MRITRRGYTHLDDLCRRENTAYAPSRGLLAKSGIPHMQVGRDYLIKNRDVPRVRQMLIDARRVRWEITQLRRSLAKPHPADRDMVYFISDGSCVKIGFAHDAEARLRKMQVGNSRTLTLLHAEPAGLDGERKYHRRFASSRVRGEWFALSPEIESFLKQRVPEYSRTVITGDEGAAEKTKEQIWA